MKEKLMSALGWFGGILFYIIMLMFCCVPFLMLDLPIWADLVLLFIIFTFRSLGGIVCLGVYVWATVRVFSRPFDVFSVVFLVFMAAYVLLFIVPSFRRK